MKASAATVVLAAIVLLATGCASGTKSGGSNVHQITLVMQTPDAPEPDAEYFISQVKTRSGGRIQILEGTDYSSNNPNNEARLVRALRSGKVEMAYIPSRAWERASSVTAFRALQAPFLVTNYSLLRQITTGPIGSGMLASLGRIGVVGLGLVPDELRRALGRRPLASPAAFRGARIRVVTSPTSELALRSLGAVPLTNFTSHQLGLALQSGRLDGAELSTIAIRDNGYVSDAHYLTANVALFAKTQTIAIRKSVFDRLSSPDQAVLRAAAAATVTHARPAAQERSELQTLCRQGLKLVQASPSDLASLRRAAASAYPMLERDAATRREITAIERLKGRASGTAALPACRAKNASRSGSKNAVLAGTYVMTASLSEIAKASGNQPNENWGSFRLVLRDGRFRMSDRRPPGQQPLVQGYSSGWTSGTYSIQGNRLTFVMGNSFGDTPLGNLGDAPIVVRWSLYRNRLTFQQAKKDEGGGPPLLYVKPWQESSASSPATRRHASGLPPGVYETKITPADVRRVGGPTWWAHWETLTYRKNGTFTDVWFHPRRADQPTTSGRYFVHGDLLHSGRDTLHWSYYRGLLTLRIVKNVDLDALGFLIIQTHPWRKIK